MRSMLILAHTCHLKAAGSALAIIPRVRPQLVPQRAFGPTVGSMVAISAAVPATPANLERLEELDGET